MESYTFVAVPICLLLLGASCRLAQHRPESVAGPAKHAEDAVAIERITKDWSTAWHAGDWAGVVALYTDDAVLMPENQPAVIGKEAIRSLYRSVFNEFTFTGSGATQEVEVAGDWGFFRSTYTMVATPKAGGEPIEDVGKWLVIVRRQPDGSWKIARLIANSDQPPPGNQ